MAQVQPPTLTLDPKLINFYAEVLHLCIETIGWPQMCNSGKGHQFPLFGWGLTGQTVCAKFRGELWWLNFWWREGVEKWHVVTASKCGIPVLILTYFDQELWSYHMPWISVAAWRPTRRNFWPATFWCSLMPLFGTNILQRNHELEWTFRSSGREGSSVHLPWTCFCPRLFGCVLEARTGLHGAKRVHRRRPVLQSRTGLHGAKRMHRRRPVSAQLQERKKIHKRQKVLQVEIWAGGALLYTHICTVKLQN